MNGTRNLLSWDNGKGRMDTTIDKDIDHGNINAVEGVDLCVCGCKYWENDKCIDCGLLIEQVKNRRMAERGRYMLEVSLNVQITTMVHYRLPWLKDAPITDLVDITSKYRELGIIQ